MRSALQQQILTSAEKLVEKGEKLLRTRHPPPPKTSGPDRVDPRLFNEWRAQVESLLERTVGRDHPFLRSFVQQTGHQNYGAAVNAMGVLSGFVEDLSQGALNRVEDLAHAEIFSDILDQAEHLLSQGYHVPAAALVGATLESEIRKLCSRNDVACNRQDGLSTLDQKCVSAKLYSSIRSKEIGYWTKIRNDADHGHFATVTKDDVTKMLHGVRSFLAEAMG